MDVEDFEFKPPSPGGPAGPALPEQAPAEPETQDLAPAGFNERFLAYAVDVAPFFFGAYFSFSLLLKNGAVDYSASTELKWKLLWTAAFVLYETIFSSGGRATLGKYLLGIRVVHADGENYLSVPGALVRVLGYALSSVFLSLGFLMALFTRNNRALHDYISQSRVISVKQRGEMGDGLVLALSWAIMAILIGSWGKQAFVKPNPEETAQIMAARTTVNKLATLEEIHKAKYNAYTDDIKRLAFLTRNLEAVRRELAKNLAPDTLAIASDGRVYIITAKARDRRQTTVRRESAPPQQ